MKTCSKCGVEKELDAFYLQSRGKCGRTAMCRECNKKRLRVPEERRVRRRGKEPGYAAKYRQKNAEKLALYMDNWRKNNPVDPVVAAKRMAKWRKMNPEKAKASYRKWQQEHLALDAAKTMRRKAQKLQATPAWADQRLIQFKYDLATRMTKATGYQWDVDHIVPLKHKLVCGLHVENNLQVITHAANMHKSNQIQL